MCKQVYRKTVEPIIPIIFQRTKATCFAYGQTGANILTDLAMHLFNLLNLLCDWLV